MTGHAHPDPLEIGLRTVPAFERRQLRPVDDGSMLTVTVDPTSRVIRAMREVDLSTAGLLEHFLEVEASSGESVTVDLSGVTFIDSFGIAALLRVMAL